MDSQRFHRRLDFVVSLPRVFLLALVRYHWRFLEIGKRIFLTLRQRYLPDEAFENGLLNPDTPSERILESVSRSQMVAIQRRLNPREWDSVLYDKGIFYRVCMAAGLPVPELYALYYRDFAGWTSCGRSPLTVQEWKTFFLSECPADFVIKPSRGEYGCGIMSIRRENGEFVDHQGKQWDTEGLLRHLHDDRNFTSFVVQERLQNHSALAKLGRGEGVHSFRLVTYVDSLGRADVVAADVKFIVGSNVVSNLAHGLNGNLIADVDHRTGAVKGVFLVDTRNGGYQEVTCHPDSGASLMGLVLPQWEQIRAVAIAGALFFRPVRTVGWDIALSTRGPRIMEGNVAYDPSLTGYLSDYWAIDLKESPA